MGDPKPKRKTLKVPFTKTVIASLATPPDGRVYYYDTRTRGLAVCVTAAGSRVFYYYYKMAGRPERYRIGEFPGLTVENARNIAKQCAVKIAAGVSPHQAKRQKRQEPTFGYLWTEWAERYGKQRLKGWKETERIYNTLLRPLHSRQLSTIKRTDIQRLHSKIGTDNGPYAANRALDVLKSVFNQAEDFIGWTGENPCRRVRQFEKKARDRFLHGDEMPKFWAALNQEDALFRDFFALCLLTGARRGNVQAMRWDEIDWGSSYWRIPETKNGQPVVVPLVAPALEILTDRKTQAGDGPWVFPSRGKSGHLVEVKSAWARILKRSGLVDLRPHDLRRSLGSWMAIQNTSLTIVGKALGHVSQAATAVYARLSFDPVRNAVDAATAAMMQAANPEQESQEGAT